MEEAMVEVAMAAATAVATAVGRVAALLVTEAEAKAPARAAVEAVEADEVTGVAVADTESADRGCTTTSASRKWQSL